MKHLNYVNRQWERDKSPTLSARLSRIKGVIKHGAFILSRSRLLKILPFCAYLAESGWNWYFSALFGVAAAIRVADPQAATNAAQAMACPSEVLVTFARRKA